MALVNSVNPMRLEGQKTAAFEIVDFLGDAPDVHVLPVGNAGNISAYWKGYREYAKAGRSTRRPRMRGWQAAGAAPLVPGAPVPDPETVASAIRIGNPASWHLAVAAARRVRRPLPRGHRRADPRRPARARRARRRLRRAGLGRRRRRAAAGARARARRTPASRIVVTVTGHGLKDIDTALSTFTDLVDTVVDADVDAAAGRGGLR